MSMFVFVVIDHFYISIYLLS